MVERIIAIGGEPASGKTTLVRKLMEGYNLTPFKYGLVRGLYDKEENIYFIGVFDGSTFEGTDKLSMAVQPDFVKFLNNRDGGVVIFEGDRLFNNKLFTNDLPFVKVILRASKEVIDKRHQERGDNQTERFIGSRNTKINNIMKEHTDYISILNNDDESAVEIIKTYIRWN
jgi:deoxyadenosine/deoxycytidine kinase